MASRDELLSIIDRGYEARCSGDKEAVLAFLAPGATFCLNGERQQPLAGFPQGYQPADAVIGALIDQFRFHSIERLESFIDGNRAAIHTRIVVSAGDGDPVTTELFDLWTFDDDGKVVSLLQFADTALVAQMAG